MFSATAHFCLWGLAARFTSVQEPDQVLHHACGIAALLQQIAPIAARLPTPTALQRRSKLAIVSQQPSGCGPNFGNVAQSHATPATQLGSLQIQARDSVLADRTMDPPPAPSQVTSLWDQRHDERGRGVITASDRWHRHTHLKGLMALIWSDSLSKVLRADLPGWLGEQAG